MNEKQYRPPKGGIKLIALDMDGTLLNRRQRISAENAAALRHALNYGVKLAIISGRAPVEIEAITDVDVPGLPIQIIGLNGAHVREAAGEDRVTLLGAEIFKECVRLAEARSAPYAFYTYGGLYSNRPYGVDRALPMRRAAHSEALRYADRVIKFLVYSHDTDMLAALREEISMLNVSVSSTWSDNFEVNARGISKGSALRLLAERLNIPKENVLAAGDQENDLTMLEWAGVPVVMENAGESLLKLDAYRTGHHEQNGVAQAIYHYIPQEPFGGSNDQ